MTHEEHQREHESIMQIVCERVDGVSIKVFGDSCILTVRLDIFTSFLGIAMSVKVIMHFYSHLRVGYCFLI